MSYTPRHAKPSYARRRTALFAAGVGVAAAAFANPAAASAQTAPVLPQLSSNLSSSTSPLLQQANAQLSSLGSSADTAARDAAWNTRNSLRQQAEAITAVNPALAEQVKTGIDQTVETFFPGLIDERTPKPAPAPAPAPEPEVAPEPAPAPAFDYGACPKSAKVCVDLAGQRSWLQRNGEVYYGDVHVATGKAGAETPRGTFYVNRKVKDEISYEFNNAPMPYAVYFTYNGIAFHQGDPAYMSNGCVRMYRADAEKYFNDLQIGDQVVVF